MKSFYDDRPMIANKYHCTDEPFDPYHRMQYHGYAYDPSTEQSDE